MSVLIIFVVSIVIACAAAINTYKKVRVKADKRVIKLLKDGQAFSVDADKVMVKSRDYWVEGEEESLRVSMYDSIYRRPAQPSRDQKIISVLIYEGERKGKSVRYVSVPIYKDEVTIRATLMNLQKINIYIDHENEENYFVDIRPLIL